jgi:outer membrane lipopolysaccharide assembly protein LptE/RlpB
LKNSSYLAGVLALALAGCGYHVAGATNLLPREIHTIAVPAWGNATTQYKLSGYMAEAMTRELITRTRYAVIADPAKADATLYGSVVNMVNAATTYDVVTGRSTGAQILVQVQVRLVAKDGKVLFTRPNLDFRDRYEISVNPGQYLDETQGALQRLSRDVARTVVSAVLENF